MSDTLLATKVHVPPLHGNLVNRSSLVTRLNDGVARGCRLTLISAPAGYGKSTLLSEWQAQAKLPVAWLSLEKGENSPTRFWSYFVAALNTLAPVQRANIGSAIFQAARTLQPGSMEDQITELINEISTLEEPVCLVLDDMHSLSDSQIHQDLTFLIEHLPQDAHNLHLVATSRMDPPWPLARWRARRELNELRAIDLRFEYEETGQFLQGALSFKLSPQEIAALQDRTEGWISGLQMAAFSMQARYKSQGPESVSLFIKTFSGSNRYILDYLLDEVFSQQTEEIRSFMYQTSILDQLSASLCDAVIDKPGSQAYLDQLERANLFLIPLDEEQQWYRYHHLFAEFLRKQIKQLCPERIPQLHRRASDWFAANHMPSEAIRHALAAGDIDRVHQAVAGNALAMVENAELFDVLRNFNDLSNHQFSSNPWLCMAYAWAKAYADPTTGMNELLQKAEHVFDNVQQDSERRHLCSHLAAIRAYLAWMNGEAERALEFVQRAMENLPEEDWAARTHVLNIQGLALQYQGDFFEATRSFEAALAVGKKVGRVHELLYTSSNLAYAQLLQGHLREAFSMCQIAVYKTEEVHQSSQRFPVLAHAYATKSNILLEWNDLESAVSLARQAVALAEQWGQADALNYAMSCLSQALGAAGEFEEAFAVNQQAMKVTGTISPWYARISAENEIMLLLAKGDLTAAANKFEGFFSNLEEDRNDRVLFMQVSLLYQQNQFFEVITRIEKSLDALQQKGWNLLWIKLLPIYALSLHALGRKAEAQEVLERCLAAAEPEGFVRMFVEGGAPMASLLTNLQNRGIKVDYITKLLAAFHLPEEAPKPGKSSSAPARSAVTDLVEPLSERELDVLRYLNSHLGVPEIAGEMMIAPTTLRTHIHNIYQKLDVHGRLEALQKARNLGLI